MPDAEAPFRMMTYRALSAAWDCSLEAAQERVRRNRWRKQQGNGRQMLVAVPLHVLEQAVGHDAPQTPTDLREAVQAQREREFQALRDRAETAEAEVQLVRRVAEEARREADRALGKAAGLREGLRVAEAAVQRADEGRREVDARAVGMQATADRERDRATGEGRRAAEAEQRAIDAIRRAEAAEEARRAFLAAPWWRRLRGRP